MPSRRRLKGKRRAGNLLKYSQLRGSAVDFSVRKCKSPSPVLYTLCRAINGRPPPTIPQNFVSGVTRQVSLHIRCNEFAILLPL